MGIPEAEHVFELRVRLDSIITILSLAVDACETKFHHLSATHVARELASELVLVDAKPAEIIPPIRNIDSNSSLFDLENSAPRKAVSYATIADYI